jgi:hypothetical protein
MVQEASRYGLESRALAATLTALSSRIIHVPHASADYRYSHVAGYTVSAASARIGTFADDLQMQG